MAAEEVRRAIVLSGGPYRNTSVTPDFVRLHDDKSTFTGDDNSLPSKPLTYMFSGRPRPHYCTKPLIGLWMSSIGQGIKSDLLKPMWLFLQDAGGCIALSVWM